MPETFDPAGFVPAAASAVGLPLAGDELADVVAAFAVLARVAAPLMEFRLEDDAVAAAVFVPQGGTS
jgi:hypothetical protein